MSESADLLRRARAAAGLSQRDLARRAGVPQPLISAYEKGRRQPGADMLLRLVRATGHDLTLYSTVEASRDAAAKLEQVVAIASALPARRRGPLTFPSWRALTS
jgi:transcriptional regulator with XRE-family HTH domain